MNDYFDVEFSKKMTFLENQFLQKQTTNEYIRNNLKDLKDAHLKMHQPEETEERRRAFSTADNEFTYHLN
jgi:hypothetical protein